MTTSMTSPFRFIQTLSDLTHLCGELAGEKALGVDTEADSLHHYYPKVCLIQISTNQHTSVIDPLAIGTMAPLDPLFASHKTKKIFHGADYDLRSLFRDSGIRVNNLFDTMVGSQFTGEKEAALANVVKKRFGIAMDKKYQRANWSKRPLSRDMMEYAARDSAHLIRLYGELREELKSIGRLSWVEEECEILSLACTVENNPHGIERNGEGSAEAPLFRRFKGAGKMVPRDLAVLESILQFREKTAMEQDRPPFRVFSNRVVKDLVTAKPSNRKALESIANLPSDFMKCYGRGVLEATRAGLGLPRDRLPSFPRTRRPPRDPEKEARLKRLKTWRSRKSNQLELEPGLICNNVLLDALAHGNPKDVHDLKTISKMKAWQRRSLGPEIVQVLREGT